MTGKKVEIIAFAVLIAVCGCGPSREDLQREGRIQKIEEMSPVNNSDLPEMSGGFAVTIRGQTVTVNEVIKQTPEAIIELARKTDLQQFQKQAGPAVDNFIKRKIADAIIYKRAKNELIRKNPDVDEILKKLVAEEINKYVATFNGDYAKADLDLAEKHMTWADFAEYQEKLIVTQSYISEKMGKPKPITHDQLVDYYNQIKNEVFAIDPCLVFRLIDIQPGRLAGADATDLQVLEKKAEARKLATELLQRINAGEDFGELATKYSHGHRAAFGGLWKPVRPGSLAEPYDRLEQAADNMRGGEISPVIETRDHIFIIKLEQKQLSAVKAFEQVQHEVQEQLIMDRRIEEADKLMADIMAEADAENIDEFVNTCISRIYTSANKEL
ncbi:MAG: peptidylprolyl isomerase [Planctomycetota bacterium]